MVFIQSIIFVVFMFIGLMIFLRYMLTRNITSATGHLEDLSKDYALKQEEITKRLDEAKQESQKIIAQAKQEAGNIRDGALKESDEKTAKIIADARQSSERMIAQAERTCEFLKNEEVQRVAKIALDKAGDLLCTALPEEFLKKIHALWMEDYQKSEFQLGRIHLPEDVKEVKVSSAFPLEPGQAADLNKKLKKKLGDNIKLEQEIDSELVAGFVITVGSVVIDASLKYEIQKIIKKRQK